MYSTCRTSSCHTSPLTSDFLAVLFTKILLVTSFAEYRHFGLDNIHQDQSAIQTVRTKKDASSTSSSGLLSVASRIIKDILVFYTAQPTRFITVFTTARHWSLP
jgi:hypothetical protein